MKHHRIKGWIACAAMATLASGMAPAAELVLVDQGTSTAPVIVAADAPPATTEAVRELATYIEKISGAKPDVITGVPDPAPAHAVWVGAHPGLDALFPGADLDFTHPEEILHLCNGRHLLIAGRDRLAGDKQTEHGTANAIYTFIEKQLGVRWLWPGELGEDILQRETIALAPFEYRHHPVFLKRHFWPYNPRDWQRRQRIHYYAYPFQAGHAFTDWWEKYHKTKPEYFALLPNGTRTPPREGSTVKLCTSNPGVWSQWLDNAERKLEADPTLLVLSATPNDGPWHCTCDRCRAWDHPDAPPNVLTERHVKFWNILARGLRERVPEREVYVGALAYAAYYAPPIEATLEPNIAIAQVGHFPLTDAANRAQAKADWQRWAKKATRMLYRPNLWYWAGGVWGLPEVAMRKTVEDFRFLADNKCIGITVDVVRNVWATQGPQYYLMAQLAYDPYQDGNAVLQDYYRRAFGPAAPTMATYWTMMEEASDAVMADPDFKRGSNARYKLPDIFTRVYSEEWMARVDQVLRKAEGLTADSDLYRRRVAYVRAGFDFTRLLVRTIPLMTRVRESQARDVEAIRQAQANWDAIAALGEAAEPYALPIKNIRDTFIGGRGYQGGMQDYFGPPSEDLLNAQFEESVTLRPAEWTLAFEDPFQRTALGPDWTVKDGKWGVEDGALVTRGEGTVMSVRTFPGLQKIEFEATATPNPGVSDISPFIHCDTNGFYSGYFLRFGGNYNKDSGILRKGRVMRESRRVIEPNRTHAIVAESDGNHVRLRVDGETVAEFKDERPLIGDGHGRIGFYVYEGTVRIRNLKVYTSPAVRMRDVTLEGEGFE